MIKKRLHFQIEEWKGNQVFHQNLEQEDTLSHLFSLLTNQFRQAQITTLSEDISILISKKGTVTVKSKNGQAKPLLSLSTIIVQKNIYWRKVAQSHFWLIWES